MKALPILLSAALTGCGINPAHRLAGISEPRTDIRVSILVTDRVDGACREATTASGQSNPPVGLATYTACATVYRDGRCRIVLPENHAEQTWIIGHEMLHCMGYGH